MKEGETKANPRYKIKIICAWCGKGMGEKEGKGHGGISYGTCDDCFLKNFPHEYEKVKAGKEEQK